MVGWHHQLNGHEFQQAPGDGERQGSLERCRPWDCKESDMTEQLNNRSNITLASLSHEYPRRREGIFKEVKGSQHVGGRLQEVRSGYLMGWTEP